ncbi:hypothetical protein PV04_07261 [Phialophora macrospora]|uniref:nitrilase n=1 Tax=Phialophora macrospora TaxID=1851006 RepID=A0A0D2DS37_9EURO|nr:hypothetical protein PV04_07261 [Phialophora macrospora]
MSQRLRVAAVQAEPVWNDLDGSVQKTISLILEAGQNGAKVLGFPEVFIPGYPWSMYAKSPYDNGPFMDEYLHNSLARDSLEMKRICAAVKEAGLFCVLGYSERDKHSLYISQSYINQEGLIVYHRRKIKPTHVERAYWGTGEGGDLKNVIDTPFGRIGALNCWEHTQPLLKFYEYSQDVDIHIASWPSQFKAHPKWLYSSTGTMSQHLSQTMAFEGSCFVLVCSQVVSKESEERNGIKGWEITATQLPGGGFSQIFGPGGKPLCLELAPDEEGILYADIDLEEKCANKQFLDLVGHYSRPDLLSLRANPYPSRPVHLASESAEVEQTEPGC